MTAQEQTKEDFAFLLGSDRSNPLKAELARNAKRKLGPPKSFGTLYQHFVVETDPDGEQQVHVVQGYSERDFRHIQEKPVFRFRWKCEGFLKTAEKALNYPDGSPQLEAAAAALWANITLLSEFIGVSSEVDELISALEIASASFATKITPKPVFEALLSVLSIVDKNIYLTTSTVDTALDILEQAGIDLNYPLSFGKE